MQPNLYPPLNYGYCRTGNTPFPQLSSSIEHSSSKEQQNNKRSLEQKKKGTSVQRSEMNDSQSRSQFGAPLAQSQPVQIATPSIYKQSLTPRPSVLHPHCLARDRLRLWVPAGESTRQLASTLEKSQNHEVSDEQLDRILDVIGSVWAQSTKETYGAGLLVFHVYCDINHVEEDKCCPVNPNLLLEFLSSCAGSYSGSAIANFVAGIKAWHLLHGRAWMIQPGELKTLLKGTSVLAPPSSKCPKRQPFNSQLHHMHPQPDGLKQTA
ncbi:uncharacterized protein F5147DRAFT_769451 [Suillus discolor]|uniref:Uncharacterized protein n=1 Tax=Suillus discolor TaxID=1912936 RepID=A0A9P7FEN7_9AGAM|nr:uncharacterized protein F5147DRAFT_769451 [Suillus discolor]KAG2116061.1 hypothetical protein F5147DRAFT_769451 [Suillus discolor]